MSRPTNLQFWLEQVGNSKCINNKSQFVQVKIKLCCFHIESLAAIKLNHLMFLSNFNMSLHVFPQMVCPWGCIVTLVASIRLFSTVCFQMCPQIACPGGCKVTLVAFVRLFATVPFQMFPQIACMKRGIVTLDAFVWLFSTVCFQMCP